MHRLHQNQIRISVRNLVEFVLRSGDLDNRRSVKAEYDAMQLGSRLHRKIQSSMEAGYRSEVSLKYTACYQEVLILLEGRADGIAVRDGRITIDEIKVIRQDLDQLEDAWAVHTAQAVCYGYIYASRQREEGSLENTEQVDIQITYCHPETEQIRRFLYARSYEELEEEFNSYIREYGKWAQFLYEHRLKRAGSIQGLEFPYEYRPGQRRLVVAAYKTMISGQQLFIQAPTGIGKTLSAVYPAVQAVGQEYADKIFYLTAKTITRTAAVSAFEILRERGLLMSWIVLTSKEKICLNEEMDCNPVSCPYAKGHFDRVNAAVFDLIQSSSQIDRALLQEYARRYQVCPFELSLDVSYWVDAIICDYNYLFDPHVRLQRFFADGAKGEYLFLVDEAHNLVERARTMYSADLEKEEFLEAKRYYRDFPAVVKQLGSCNRRLLELKRECDRWKLLPEGEGIGAFVMGLEKLYEEMNRVSEKFPQWNPPKEADTFYFHVRDFLEVYEQLDENYQVYMEHTPQETFALHLLCVNPAKRLQECCAQGLSTVFFSATLLPICYYKELLGTGEASRAIYADSPFEKEKRLILAAGDVTTRYTRRSPSEYEKISAYIRTIIRSKRGNYLVFFPSYSFLEAIEELLEEEDSGTVYVRQEASMNEEQREGFLEQFQNPDVPVVGLCVMGGIFSEGIDLQNEAVIGVIVVGTGLPQVSPRQEVLKQHYEAEGKDGFLFAYLYPGMNKVLQAAGRLIRTSEDYGVIALLDERFLQRAYSSQFPPDWTDCKTVRLAACGGELSAFWERLGK